VAADPDADEMFQAFMKFLPLRALATFSPDKFSEAMLGSLIEKLTEELRQTELR
jgi:beta-glucosidase